jgi:hypothetical protein
MSRPAVDLVALLTTRRARAWRVLGEAGYVDTREFSVYIVRPLEATMRFWGCQVGVYVPTGQVEKAIACSYAGRADSEPGPRSQTKTLSMPCFR